MDTTKIHYLTNSQINQLTVSLENKKHKLIILLMLDCGLRVTECISLQLNNFDFKKRLVYIDSLKKRDKKLIRQIPISDRLYSVLADYIYSNKQLKPDGWLFPSPVKEDDHLTRFAVSKVLKRNSTKKTGITNLHPHTLRHTFATQHLSEGTPIENIKTMLGHSSLNTTLIYTHIPTENLRKNIAKVTGQRVNFLSRTLKKMGLTTPQKNINIAFHNQVFTVGRNEELQQVFNNAQKKINTIIIGSTGVGKSHFIKVFKEYNKQLVEKERTATNSILKQSNSVNGIATIKNVEIPQKALKIIYWDDVDNIKLTLAETLLFFYKGDMEAIFKLTYPDYDYTKLHQKLSRNTTINLALELIKITPVQEYVLLIDNVDRISAKSVTILEKLRHHFTVITTSREVSINKGTFLWNYEIVKLENLERKYAEEMIDRLCTDIETTDYSTLKHHINEQSNGNPRAIEELVNRFKKEPLLNTEVIRSVKHMGALRDIDCTFIIMLFLALIACMRYLASSVQNPNMRLIGGIGMVLLFISRYFFKHTVKRTI